MRQNAPDGPGPVLQNHRLTVAPMREHALVTASDGNNEGAALERPFPSPAMFFLELLYFG